MTKEEIISQKLAAYDDAFDFYMDRGRMPDGVPSDDLLGGDKQPGSSMEGYYERRNSEVY